MRLLLGLLVLVGVALALPPAASEGSDPPTNTLPVPEDTLKQLSQDGERMVEEEVQKALYGVEEMKEVMRSNELKHGHLMRSLRRSGEKKQRAAQLTQEVLEQLQKAEEQCRDTLQSEWEQCRPCLEEACKAFYTSTCRRGFASFRAKAGRFFHRVTGRFFHGWLGPTEAPSADPGDLVVNRDPVSQTDAEEVARIEASFGQLVQQVGGLVERSRALVEQTRSRLDGALRGAFFFFGERDGDEKEATESATLGPLDPVRDSGFLQGVGLEEVLDSFYDFSRSVAEEFGAVVAAKMLPGDIQEVPGEKTKQARNLFPRYLHSRQLCRDLRRQTSECWQLQDRCETCQGPLLEECPSVRELHVALEEANQLLEVAGDQYREILSVVQHHSDQTVRWLGTMAARCSWVAPEMPAAEAVGVVGNSSSSATAGKRPWDVFRITTVLPKNSAGVDSAHASETEVQVYILNSPPIVFSVPGELSIQESGFLQYVTQEALGKYKAMVRIEDEDE